ncbi:MAG: c-type cytochrome [Acidobacteriota bacterium]
MNYLVLILVIAAMLFLRWRGVGILTWIVAWWLAIYVILQYGFATPIPQSVISLYMAIITGVLLLYVTSDEALFRTVREPLVNFVTNRRYTLGVLAIAVLIPCLVAANVYLDMTAPVSPPFFARSIHPANPNQITVNGENYDLVTLQNPYRILEETNPEQFKQHVENGREVYYKNCFYCHGDNMSGNGMFAHGLNPIPTNFDDTGTIPALQESFLFWRISKGGPGLPEEGGPWESAMPAWEKFLSEEEIWDVILFLYDFTEQRPRAREETITE